MKQTPENAAGSAAPRVRPRRRWRRRLCLLAVVYLVLAGCAMTFQDRIIFLPSRYPDGQYEAARFVGSAGRVYPKIEDCQFAAADHVNLHGWYCTPVRRVDGQVQNVSADMVLLWMHGNAGNLSYRYGMIASLMELPVEVFIFDYRGYGKSEGTPSEQGIYRDAQAAWDYLTKTRGVKPERIVVFGKSLGGAPAIDLTLRLQEQGVRPAGLIVQSSFTSIPAMAGALRVFMPESLFYTKMDSLTKIKTIACPKLFVHGPRDEVIPYWMGRKLYEAAPEPKRFLEVPNAGHNETWLAGGAAYLEALRAFVASVRPGVLSPLTESAE